MLRNRALGRLCLATLLMAAGIATLAALAAPAQAEVFHVKLRSGATIDTLYQPQQASWDPSLVLLLTDTGNWIGIHQQDVEGIQSESQIRGFGIALNFNTVAIGWAPNDAVDPAMIQANPQAAAQQALQNFYQQQQAQAHYTIPQFVSTEQTAGVPPRLVGGGLPQVPSPLPTPVPVPMPATPSVPSAAPPGAGGVPNS